MSEKDNIYTKLNYIQQNLKAPKNQKNNFGNYKYRSAEDILEAVKPLLKETKTTLLLNDSIEVLGQGNIEPFLYKELDSKGKETVNVISSERYYVKATATLINDEDGESVSVSAYAREENNKKGMDLMQLTGATSSYARKYAMNGLFAIDDTKDADTNEYTTSSKPKAVSPKATKGQIEKIKKLYTNKELAEILNKKEEEVEALIPKFSVTQADTLISKKGEKNGK